MDYNEFADRFLAAVYLETERDGATFVRAGSVVEKYNLTPKPHWISRMADDWEHTYFKSVSKTLGGYDGWSFRISARGFDKVETDFVDLDEVAEFLGAQGEATIAPPEDPSLDSGIDSSAWTGIERRLALNPKVVEEIDGHIQAIDRLVERSGLKDSECARAKAVTEALRSLVASPQPEWKIIVELLNSPALTAVLNVAQIIQITLALILGT